MQNFTALALIVPEIIRGVSLKTPGPLNDKKAWPEKGKCLINLLIGNRF